MRQTRRGMIAQSGKAKYVWAVYTLKAGLDPSTATTGSFTLAQNNYKMMASEYTVSGSTFTLTSPVQTTGANLKAGQYIVNITTSSNTGTTGTYIYEITGVTGTTTRTISYIRYTASASTTGSFALAQANYKMASNSYTLSDKTFTLTAPVQTTAANLQIGQYLVNITTSSNTATTGAYIYLITNITGTTTKTISYTRYSPGRIKDAYLYNVESDTMDYPIDGEQSGLWYTMLRGEYMRYNWDVYNITTNTYYTLGLGGEYDDEFYNYTNLTAYTSASINSTTGVITLSGKGNYSGSNLAGKYYGEESSSSGKQSYIKSISIGAVGYVVRQDLSAVSNTEKLRGTSTGQSISSDKSNAYPSNNYQGNYWYVSTGSYYYIFDNT